MDFFVLKFFGNTNINFDVVRRRSICGFKCAQELFTWHLVVFGYYPICFCFDCCSRIVLSFSSMYCIGGLVMQKVEMLNQQNQSSNFFSKLRLTKNEVCDMLSVGRDRLSRIEKEDPTFPRSIKDGLSRQAAVYYDYQEILDWYLSWKEKNRQYS